MISISAWTRCIIRLTYGAGECGTQISNIQTECRKSTLAGARGLIGNGLETPCDSPARHSSLPSAGSPPPPPPAIDLDAKLPVGEVVSS